MWGCTFELGGLTSASISSQKVKKCRTQQIVPSPTNTAQGTDSMLDDPDCFVDDAVKMLSGVTWYARGIRPRGPGECAGDGEDCPDICDNQKEGTGVGLVQSGMK
jgi:hypothetical protein